MSADGSLSERCSNRGQDTIGLVEAFVDQIAVAGVIIVAPSRVVVSRVWDAWNEQSWIRSKEARKRRSGLQETVKKTSGVWVVRSDEGAGGTLLAIGNDTLIHFKS